MDIAESARLNTGLKKTSSCPAQNGNHEGYAPCIIGT